MAEEKIVERYVLKVFNGEESDENKGVPTAMIAVDAPDVATWAKEEMGTIGGVRWESDGDDFAYAMLPNEPGLIAKLEAEGYVLDASEFVEAR